jgi:hypothetical protein
MADKKKRRETDDRAERDYQAVKDRIAPFLIPKPIKPVSTAGQWRDSSSARVCSTAKRK